MRHISTRSLVLNLAMLAWLLGGADSVSARITCGSDPSDEAAIVATDDVILQQCQCNPSVRHSAYLKCARKAAMAASKAGTLPRRCVSTVKLCAVGSTCGYPNSSVPSCYLHTPTPTTVPTPTPTLPPVCVPPALNVPPHTVHVATTLTEGTTDCGGPFPSKPPAPPVAGIVDDGVGTGVGLGLGCLYAGALPATSIPFGSTSIVDVVGFSGTTITVGPSNGSDPSSCTRGAGPLSHCIDGGAGIDGGGACNSDAQCNGRLGACALDANCYFGPPVPVSQSVISSCAISVFQSDLCGKINVSSNTTNLTGLLSSRLYLTGDAESPCPQCIAGTCKGGENDGKLCTAVGSVNTSPDCPPLASKFLGTLSIYFPALTTGTSGMSDNIGEFCPGQTLPGAFGWPQAKNLHLTGSALGSSSQNFLAQTLVSTFCVPVSHSDIVDTAGQLPTVGALSAPVVLDLSQILPLLP